jgi:hypothetical protein
MPSVPHTSENFTDVLDPRFDRIWNDEYNAHPDYIPILFDQVTHSGRDNMRYSSVSALDDFQPFTGTVQYQAQSQGYDVIMTFLEFVSGFQLDRKLYDDDQYDIWDDDMRALAAAAYRTRQKHAARMLNNAFSVDTLFYVNSEGVALCSNSHTTTTGASTSVGFDNLLSGELSATNVASARIQMRGFRGSQAERISMQPDELWYPKEKYEIAAEIINSSGKVDTAENNINVHQGRYTGREWDYLTDANNWFMCDSTARRMAVKWADRIQLEYGFAEDFDSFTAKYRAYMRYANCYRDWRWIIGSQVS